MIPPEHMHVSVNIALILVLPATRMLTSRSQIKINVELTPKDASSKETAPVPASRDSMFQEEYEDPERFGTVHNITQFCGPHR